MPSHPTLIDAPRAPFAGTGRTPLRLLALLPFAGLWSCAQLPAPLPTTAATPLVATRNCASLQGERVAPQAIGLPTSGAVVRSAVALPAAAASGAVQAVVAYCKLLGDIAPVDPAAPPIRFQLNVPMAWNGGAIQVGGGGLNGSIPANLAALGGGGSPVSAAQPPDAPYPINRGYAMFGGDSGHQGDPGTWALNDEAWRNFGHEALKKTHDTAFALLQALHGQRPRVSYFMGQSQGGREALEVAQRYPADYDGVVATAPLIGYSAHVLAKTLLAGAQTGAGWLAPEHGKLVGAEVLRQCDALDGLADGVVSNYRACNARFEAQRLRCSDGAASTASPPACLSDAQLATVARMRAPLVPGYPMANGWTSFPGYGTGREAVAWLNTTPQPRDGVRPNLGQPGTTVQFGILKDPAADLLKLELATARTQVQAASALIDSTNTDLGPFFARGGRLLIKSNAADYSVNPQILAQYVDAVRQRFGAAVVDRHLRLYVLPGAGHNGNGTSALTGEPIPQFVDLVTMALDWVERGKQPPDAPVLRAMDPLPPHTVRATRPICRYPLYPHFMGGAPEQAASYACTAPSHH